MRRAPESAGAADFTRPKPSSGTSDRALRVLDRGAASASFEQTALRRGETRARWDAGRPPRPEAYAFFLSFPPTVGNSKNPSSRRSRVIQTGSPLSRGRLLCGRLTVTPRPTRIRLTLVCPRLTELATESRSSVQELCSCGAQAFSSESTSRRGQTCWKTRAGGRAGGQGVPWRTLRPPAGRPRPV
jgi:hypothetical protein